MKTKIGITAALITAGIIALVAIAFANQRPNYEAVEDLRNEIRNYAEENIIPKMSEWKEQFDAKLDSDDLTKLNSLRAQHKAHHESAKDQRRQQFRDGSGKNRDRDAMREQRKQRRDQMQDCFEKLQPIMEKYETDLEQLADQAKPFIENWRSDLQEIRENWLESHQDEFQGRRGRHGGRGMRHFGGNGFMKMDFCSNAGMARFLLWDGTSDDFEMGQNTFGRGSGMNSGSGQKASFSHPNPFNDNTKISFNLPKEEKVQLYVFDNEGNLVETLCNETLSAGEHSYEFKPDSDASGIYYYNLKSKSLNRTGKMILNK